MAACRTCGGTLPVEPIGHGVVQIACCSDACLRVARRVRGNERYRAWRLRHPDDAIAIARKWKKANLDKVRAKNKRYRDRHVAEQRSRNVAYYNSNRDREIARAKKYREINNAKHLAAVKRWAAANPERRRAAIRKGTLTRRARVRALFVEYVDPSVVLTNSLGRCGICSEEITPGCRWHVDHIVPLSKGGKHEYANVQAAHATCNLKKSNTLPAGVVR